MMQVVSDKVQLKAEKWRWRGVERILLRVIIHRAYNFWRSKKESLGQFSVSPSAMSGWSIKHHQAMEYLGRKIRTILDKLIKI